MILSPQSLVNKSLDLVSPPDTYLKLSQLVQDPDSSIDDIANIITTYPALATRLLKIVNSPFYGFPSQINTLSRAITLIGTRELTHLVLATSVINSFKGIPGELVDINVFWRHSFATAIASKLLAMESGLRSTERFFIAGLLHNIGSLVMYLALPEMAAEAIRIAETGNEPLHKAELRVANFDHTEVGEELAKAWHLPISIQEVIRYHHAPSQADNFSIDVAIVHIADILVTSVPFGHAGDSHVPPLDDAAWELLGISEKNIPGLLEQVGQQIEEMTSVMMS